MNELILNPVFIDTSVFYQNNFDFSSKQFQQLTEISREHLIKIIITEINQKEVIRHIKELSIGAENGFKSYLRKNRLVRLNLGENFENVEGRFQKESIFEFCNSSFEKWLKEAMVEILPILHSDPREVFELYFSNQPPFQNKKHEFPDAFCLSIICNKFENINIVSRDNDMLEFKHPSVARHFNSLNDFIDHILKSKYSIHSLLIKEYNKQKKYILKNIEEGFPSLRFLTYRGWYTDSAKLKQISVVEEKIIDIQDGIATINLSVIIYYEISVYYKEDEEYQLEEDSHFMDVEIIFRFIESPFGNEFQDIKIESIKPKTNEDAIVMIKEEEFGL